MLATFILPVGTIAIMACISGVLLSAADKFLSLPVDERFALVRDALPGANCGACGYAGCDSYATALVDGSEARANLCTPGGSSVAAAIGDMLGLSAGASTPQLAFVKCQGIPEHCERTADYQGPKNCKAARMVAGGETGCQYGCYGFGDCMKVCPYNAIYIRDGIAFIDPDYCKACTLCIAECPQQLIELRPRAAQHYVSCSSKDKGAAARKICTTACIACGLCVRNCPVDAIAVEDNLAHIDPEKCINCGACAEKCPTKAIIRMEIDIEQTLQS